MATESVGVEINIPIFTFSYFAFLFSVHFIHKKVLLPSSFTQLHCSQKLTVSMEMVIPELLVPALSMTTGCCGELDFIHKAIIIYYSHFAPDRNLDAWELRHASQSIFWRAKSCKFNQDGLWQRIDWHGEIVCLGMAQPPETVGRGPNGTWCDFEGASR